MPRLTRLHLHLRVVFVLSWVATELPCLSQAMLLGHWFSQLTPPEGTAFLVSPGCLEERNHVTPAGSSRSLAPVCTGPGGRGRRSLCLFCAQVSPGVRRGWVHGVRGRQPCARSSRAFCLPLSLSVLSGQVFCLSHGFHCGRELGSGVLVTGLSRCVTLGRLPPSPGLQVAPA